ncbi:fungal-specific transcription factor domain-containing protein [Xylariaceae sp. FL0662B]|nr:fungal-specific transcription factor domain-containing protein [Xylariaceae sp. FL0662B]
MARMVLFPHDAGAGGGPPAASATKANQACYSCRKQKRKCDKALPSCGLCARMGRMCDYSEPLPTPKAEDLVALQERLLELEHRLRLTGGSEISSGHFSTHGDTTSLSHTPRPLPREPLWQTGPCAFPPALFLDRSLFKSVGLSVPRPVSDVPSEILQCMGEGEIIQRAIIDYFSDIHPWFPIVSKRRMNITYPLWDAGADVAMLYLAMKLVTSQPQDGFLASENYLYTASKRFIALLESVGTVSLQYLQALLLVALYEYGQGIYPAAWMTVAQCVRYSDFIGLPSYKESSTVLGRPGAWMEAEERRRTWWGVYVMDRVVSLGSQKRPLCGEPSPNEVLPVDEEAWDTGDMGSVVQRTVYSPRTEPQSSFGRLCQAALVVGKMLRYSQRAENRRLNGEHVDYNEVANITETAHGLCACLESDLAARPSAYLGLVGARCLAFSAILKVLGAVDEGPTGGTVSIRAPQQHQAPWTDDELSMRMAAADGLGRTAAHVRDLAADLCACAALDDELARIPPFALDAVYAAAAAFASTWKESADPVAERSLQSTKKCLARLAARWRLAAEYLKLLEHHEMNVLMGQPYVRPRSALAAGVPYVVPNMI